LPEHGTPGHWTAAGASPLTARELTESRIPTHYSPGLVDFLGPIGTLLGVAIIPYIVTYFFLGWTGGDQDPMLLIAEAFLLAVLAGMGIALLKGMAFSDVMGGFIDGCKGVTIGAIILALAVSLKEVTDAVGTADYLVAAVGDALPAVLLPGLLVILCLIIAFATGTSWGTYAVVFPIAMPLAWHIARTHSSSHCASAPWWVGPSMAISARPSRIPPCCPHSPRART